MLLIYPIDAKGTGRALTVTTREIVARVYGATTVCGAAPNLSGGSACLISGVAVIAGRAAPPAAMLAAVFSFRESR